ncbi:hypothetical protein QBC36DRAFT_377560 [Triangularia setosa]|uniref:Protein kinase domain-containing protein n=1 Tax=Triangularia setosa TaxID=2587417 RepID=A0AAN7A830_9PEZI|nr:hypothetical protein QBC36DRAFT_377560 [Podospora setosa]
MTIPDEDRFQLICLPTEIKGTGKDKTQKLNVFYFVDYGRHVILVGWKDAKPYVNDPGEALRNQLLRYQHYCHYQYLKETGFVDEETPRFKTSDLLEIERSGPNVDLVSFRDMNKSKVKRLFSSMPLSLALDSTTRESTGSSTNTSEIPRQNISRTLKLAHIQQLITAVQYLNEHLKLLHNEISYVNIMIDELSNKAKITDLGSATTCDNKAPDDVILTDVYALVRAIHAHVVRHPDEISRFDPKALKETDRWESYPSVRLGSDFENSNPAEVCFSLRSATYKKAEMSSTTRVLYPKATNAREVDLTTFWNRDPRNDDIHFDPCPNRVCRPQGKLAERRAQWLANGEIASQQQFEELESPSEPLDMSLADAAAWINSDLLPDSSPTRSSLLNRAARTPLENLLGSSRKRHRESGDINREAQITTHDRKALNKLIESLTKTTELAKKAGEEAKEAVKEAAEAATEVIDLVNAARQVAQRSLN